MKIFFIFSVIFIQSSSLEAVMPDYLPVNRVVSHNDQLKITLHLDSPRQTFLA